MMQSLSSWDDKPGGNGSWLASSTNSSFCCPLLDLAASRDRLFFWNSLSMKLIKETWLALTLWKELHSTTNVQFIKVAQLRSKTMRILIKILLREEGKVKAYLKPVRPIWLVYPTSIPWSTYKNHYPPSTLPTPRWEASLLQGYPLEIYHRHSFIDLGGERLMRTKFLF